MRRTLCILTALFLLLTLLPATALAALGTDWDDDCRGNTTPGSTEYGKHDWVKQSETPGSSCTSKGTAAYTCSYCGVSITRETKAPGHKWSAWKTTVEATCTKNGEETRKCQACGRTETRETEKKAHTWGAWTVTREATDFTMGTHAHTCQVCGREKAEDFYPDPTYKKGDRGDGVKELQEKLNAAGYDCGAADGIFGGKTEAAVQALEAANSFTTDGIAWPGVQKWLTPSERTTFSFNQSEAGFLAKLRSGAAEQLEKASELHIVAYTHSAVMNDATLAKLGYPGCYLTVEADGGTKPYGYAWYRDGKCLGTGSKPQRYVSIPGKYFCQVTDTAGKVVRTGLILVKYTGSSPRFVQQPRSCAVPWDAKAATLTCRAISGRGSDAGLVYRWQKKRGKGWVYIGEMGRTLRLKGSGIGGVYRCVVRDLKTGKKSVSRNGYVKMGLAIRGIKQKQADSGKAWLVISAAGGCAPYRIRVQLKAYTSGYDPQKRAWTGNYKLKTVWQGGSISTTGFLTCAARVPRKYAAKVNGKYVETNAEYVITISSPDISTMCRVDYTIRGK